MLVKVCPGLGYFTPKCVLLKDWLLAVHLNFLPSPPPEGFDLAKSDLDDYDKKCVERLQDFLQYEFAYANEHATKTATIAMICESSPMALLAWYASSSG
jgi:hypothetical protein